MLPATQVAIPASRHIAPTRLVTVLFPLAPVIATMGARTSAAPDTLAAIDVLSRAALARPCASSPAKSRDGRVSREVGSWERPALVLPCTSAAPDILSPAALVLPCTSFTN